ncbi:MAG TPA: MoaD/ThiS family protein [Nitrososphaera sp.]|nr:MoaD/ThiS family protein [Nitrososphaera sp.]
MAGEKNTKMISVKVLYFAQARELARGKHFEEKKVAEKTRVAELLFMILEARPNSQSLIKNIAVSVNYRIAKKDDFLSDGDEVALIPPVAGG